MENTIEIFKNNGKSAVSANQLYIELGLAAQHWKRWYVKNILNNPFSIEGVDFESLPIVGNGVGNRVATDFALSIDFSKRLAMMSRTEKGEQIRNYFIKCEKELLSDSKILALEDKVAFLTETQQEVIACVRNLSSLVSNLSKVVDTAMKVVAIKTDKLSTVAKLKTPTATSPKKTANQHEVIYDSDATLREKIKHLVNEYAAHFALPYHRVWCMLYNQFSIEHNISLVKQNKYKHENKLDVAARLGLIAKLHKTAYNLLHLPSMNVAHNIRNQN